MSPSKSQNFQENATGYLGAIIGGSEAAARSMKSPSASSLKSMVRKVTLAKFQDNQFDDCDLTFRELTIIMESIYQRLLRNYHSRIKYPGFDFEHDSESKDSLEKMALVDYDESGKGVKQAQE